MSWRERINAAVALVCWFAACLLFAQWTCHVFGFTWSWPAFIVVWIAMTIVIVYYISDNE